MEVCYDQLLTTLRQNKVKDVDTDFILAYCVYYLSNRQVWAMDLLWPFRVLNFYPEMRRKIDALSLDRRTCILFSKSYRDADWHRERTEFLEVMVRHRFRRLDIPYRVVRLPDYTLFKPRTGKR